MKATELRIGNYVYDVLDGFHNIDTINTIATDGYDFAINHCNETRFKPIDLTVQWLKKFGFVKLDEFEPTIYYLESSPRYNMKQHDGKWIVWNDKALPTDTIQIEYVHQLQNLYFALSGQELTFKHEE